jgi:hypothetical protein
MGAHSRLDAPHSTHPKENPMKTLCTFAISLVALAGLLAAPAAQAYDQGSVSSTDWVVEQITPYGYSAAWKSGTDKPIVNVAAASPAKPRFRSYGEATSASGTWFPDHKPLAYGESMDRSKIMALQR